MDTQIPNNIAPKIPPKLWQIPNNIEESKMDKVCLFAFNELAIFVDWFAESKEMRTHYLNNILLLITKMSEKFNTISTGCNEYIMSLEEEHRKLRDKNEAFERYAELCRFSDLEEEEETDK